MAGLQHSKAVNENETTTNAVLQKKELGFSKENKGFQQPKG